MFHKQSPKWVYSVDSILMIHCLVGLLTQVSCRASHQPLLSKKEPKSSLHKRLPGILIPSRSLTGRLIDLSELRSRDQSRVRVSPSGQYVARVSDYHHLQVWSLQNTPVANTLIFDLNNSRLWFREIAWTKTGLLYSFVKDATDPEDAIPYDYKYDFLKDHSETRQWDPSTRKEQRVFDYAVDMMLPNKDGTKVALFLRTVDLPVNRSGSVNLSILQMPEHNISNSIKMNVPDIQEMNPPYPLLWSRDNKSLFLIGPQSGPDPVSPKTSTTQYSVLMSLNSEGKVKILNRGWIEVRENLLPRMRLECRWAVPWVTPLSADADVALFLENGIRDSLLIGYYDRDGLVKERSITRKDWPESLPLLKNERGVSYMPEPIALTPDGNGILFQANIERDTKTTDAIRIPIYLWDLNARKIARIGEAGRIKEVYDWTGGRYLAFRAEGDKEIIGGDPRYWSEYGIIDVWQETGKKRQ